MEHNKNLIKTARHKCNMRVQGVGWREVREGHRVVGAGFNWRQRRLMIAINPVTVGHGERQ